MQLRIGRRAQQQAARIKQWWVEHREAAPDLFVDELEATFRFLCSERGAGVRWPTPRRPTLRRILLPRSKNHVYFVVDERSSCANHEPLLQGADEGVHQRQELEDRSEDGEHAVRSQYETRGRTRSGMHAVAMGWVEGSAAIRRFLAAALGAFAISGSREAKNSCS